MNDKLKYHFEECFTEYEEKIIWQKFSDWFTTEFPQGDNENFMDYQLRKSKYYDENYEQMVEKFYEKR